MNQLHQTVLKLDKFFYDLYRNKEASQTEVVNFFNNYVVFILQYNKLDFSDAKINLHLQKKFKSTIQEFTVKQPKKKKHKLRNKENVKKSQYNKFASTIACCDIDRTAHILDIYLNKNNCSAKNIEDLGAFVDGVSSLGHEVEHFVQEFISGDLVQACEDCYQKKVEAFNKYLGYNGTKGKMVRKLAEKLHSHADAFAITNSCEINADNNAVVYFNELFKLIKTLTNRESNYYYFIYDICIDLERIQQYREFSYEQSIHQDEATKKSLVRDFGIAEDALEII